MDLATEATRNAPISDRSSIVPVIGDRC